jgi:hypothetical protein
MTMADYKRKRNRSGTTYSGRRSYPKRRPYIPNLGGGGYGGPRNYFRTHDFRYEREPASKPPKTETHYEVIERPSTGSYRFPAYRPEPDQDLMERAVGRAMEKYLRNDSEQKQEPQAETGPELETQPNLQEAGIETKRTEPIPAIEKASEIDLAEPAEPLLEISQDLNAINEKGVETKEAYELPVADLELLLVELDADALEVRPEKNIEAEAGPEQ